ADGGGLGPHAQDRGWPDARLDRDVLAVRVYVHDGTALVVATDAQVIAVVRTRHRRELIVVHGPHDLGEIRDGHAVDRYENVRVRAARNVERLRVDLDRRILQTTTEHERCECKALHASVVTNGVCAGEISDDAHVAYLSSYHHGMRAPAHEHARRPRVAKREVVARPLAAIAQHAADHDDALAGHDRDLAVATLEARGQGQLDRTRFDDHAQRTGVELEPARLQSLDHGQRVDARVAVAGRVRRQRDHALPATERRDQRLVELAHDAGRLHDRTLGR